MYKIFIAVMFLVVILTGCGISRDAIEETCKTSMQEFFNTGEKKQYNITVVSVSVVKADRKYEGIAKVMYDSTVYSIPINVTVDGSEVLWKTDTDALLGIEQAIIQKAQAAAIAEYNQQIAEYNAQMSQALSEYSQQVEQYNSTQTESYQTDTGE